MSRIIGTQEFMGAHKDHTLSLSIVSTIDNIHKAAVEETPYGFIAYSTEKLEEEWVQDTGHYLSCIDCKVEMEINSYDVNED